MSTTFRPRSKRRAMSYTSWLHPRLDPAQRRYLDKAMADTHAGQSTVTPAKRNMARIHFIGSGEALDVPYVADALARSLFPKGPAEIIELHLLAHKRAYLRPGTIGWIEALK